MAALERMKREPEFEPRPDEHDDDHQQLTLERYLRPFRTRVLNAGSPEKEITEIAYSLIHQQVHSLISELKGQFRGSRIVILGVITINTDPDDGDFGSMCGTKELF